MPLIAARNADASIAKRGSSEAHSSTWIRPASASRNLFPAVARRIRRVHCRESPVRERHEIHPRDAGAQIEFFVGFDRDAVVERPQNVLIEPISRCKHLGRAADAMKRNVTARTRRKLQQGESCCDHAREKRDFECRELYKVRQSGPPVERKVLNVWRGWPADDQNRRKARTRRRPIHSHPPSWAFHRSDPSCVQNPRATKVRRSRRDPSHTTRTGKASRARPNGPKRPARLTSRQPAKSPDALRTCRQFAGALRRQNAQQSHTERSGCRRRLPRLPMWEASRGQ